MRLAFLGTPEAAVPSLRALVNAGHDIVVVITRPDRKRGRGGALSPSAVKAEALTLGLRVAHRVSDLEGLDVERGVVVAYGAMIPAAVLERIPMLNVHFSLLPRWRGAAPVERAILAGDQETGVGVMSLEAALDTGPVHLERRVAVDNKTWSELMSELANLGAAALVEVLGSPTLLEHPTPQKGTATYAEKLTNETFHLLPSMNQTLMLATVRLERAFTFINERRIRVLRAHAQGPLDQPAGSLAVVDGSVCLVASDGAIALDEVQPEGSRPMSASAWWAGARIGVDRSQWT
jgi:methionyl-tRNA formyltransferase